MARGKNGSVQSQKKMDRGKQRQSNGEEEPESKRQRQEDLRDSANETTDSQQIDLDRKMHEEAAERLALQLQFCKQFRTRDEKCNDYTGLPFDCMLKVFSNLSRKDIWAASSVNRRARQLFSHHSLAHIKWPIDKLLICQTKTGYGFDFCNENYDVAKYQSVHHVFMEDVNMWGRAYHERLQVAPREAVCFGYEAFSKYFFSDLSRFFSSHETKRIHLYKLPFVATLVHGLIHILEKERVEEIIFDDMIDTEDDIPTSESIIQLLKQVKKVKVTQSHAVSYRIRESAFIGLEHSKLTEIDLDDSPHFFDDADSFWFESRPDLHRLMQFQRLRMPSMTMARDNVLELIKIRLDSDSTVSHDWKFCISNPFHWRQIVTKFSDDHYRWECDKNDETGYVCHVENVNTSTQAVIRGEKFADRSNGDRCEMIQVSFGKWFHQYPNHNGTPRKRM